MRAIILKVSSRRLSQHGGHYYRAVFKNIEPTMNYGEQYIFDCYEQHTNSAKFLSYLKPQAMFDNLSVVTIRGNKYIDGNSQFNYLGQRHKS